MRIPIVDWKRVVAEQQALVDGHVDNVFQIEPKCFLIRCKPGKQALLLDATPQRPRALVTDAPPPVPDRPPMFGSILRRALRDTQIRGVCLLGDDRVWALDVEGADGLKRLILEAVPNRPNLLLVNADGEVERVLDGEIAKRRGTPIGAAYERPAPPNLRPEESVLPEDLDDTPFAANHWLASRAREGVEEKDAEKEEKRRERLLARIDRARAQSEKDLQALPDPAATRKQGEFLLEHFPALTTGMKKFRGVPLDPKLAPNENIDRIFQRARKAERGRPKIEARLAELRELRARVDSGELVPENQVPGRSKGKEAPRKPYRVFLAGNGDRILVGKGGRDNDETTLKVAGPNDIFLHVRGTPGAHVIVPVRKGDTVNEETLIDAAHLALHYSKMKKADRADITWTPRRNVSKPKGVKAGTVRVAREKVLHLRREPERLGRLLMALVDPE
ncbi:MAG: NFACT RNA binding domain-containing protein [Planctomycetota bacterium]